MFFCSPLFSLGGKQTRFACVCLDRLFSGLPQLLAYQLLISVDFFNQVLTKLLFGTVNASISIKLARVQCEILMSPSRKDERCLYCSATIFS